MNPDSVLLVTPRWTRDGGVGAHVQASATVLARHGLRVGVAAARVDAGEPVEGVTVFHIPRLFDAGATPRTRLGASLSFVPHAIHLHQVDEPDLVAELRERAPVLISTHTYTACTSGVHYFRPGHECTRAHGVGCVPNLLARGCAHTRRPQRLPAAYARATRGLRALALADLAVCYSSAVDRHLAANGVSARTVVPLFSTTAPPAGAGHATRRRRVVFAGRVVAPKGVGVLLRAARAVEAEFVICGDGWRSESMRGLARRLGVSERVQFRGWLGAERVARELADASVVAVPSLWPEPFGLVGIEALAAGRPVVASATGGIGDWLVDGVNGLLVQPGDVGQLARALNELLDDPARQRAMGSAGKTLVAARFSPEAHVRALTAAYRSARARWEQGRGGAAVEPAAAARG